MEDNNPYDDTIPVRVVICPTLLIPVITVKPRKKKVKSEWGYRIAIAAIILTWLILLAFSVFVTWAVFGYARGGFN